MTRPKGFAFGFSNGTEFHVFVANNCERCALYRPDGFPLCELDAAMLLGSMGYGVFPERIDERLKADEGDCPERVDADDSAEAWKAGKAPAWDLDTLRADMAEAEAAYERYREERRKNAPPLKLDAFFADLTVEPPRS